MLLLLALLLTLLASSTALQDVQDVVDLLPDQPNYSQQVSYGVKQLYRISNLDPNGVYDIKISYPATQPSVFQLQVEQVLLPLPIVKDNGEIVNKIPPRRHLLNTHKMRLRPSELQSHHSVKYRLEPSGYAIQVEFSLIAEVEGFLRPGEQKKEHCEFDIVVEQMLLEALPRDTLVLIGWILVLLAVSVTWVLPYLEKKIALGCAEDREVETKES